MKRRAIFMAFLLVPLVTLLSPLAALAESATSAPAARSELKGSLAVVAPLTVAAGNEFSLRVFDRPNQEPVPGARVWALTEEQAKNLKEEAKALKDGGTATENDFEALADAHGVPLGKTGTDGRLHTAIKEAGRYILLAAMKGYLPGFTPIAVRAVRPALAIQAPKAVAVGKEAVITVTQRGTDNPICGASVYALTRAQAESLKDAIANLRTDNSTAAADKDYEAVISSAGGFLLGQTDADGKVTHAFTEAGGYLLVAVMKGYIPGLAPLAVREPISALGIKAPARARAGHEMTLGVFDRAGNTPVADAAVYALTRGQAEQMKNELAASGEKDYGATVSAKGGTLLGQTGSDGKLQCTFTTPGSYVLVAVKSGYRPGIATINIAAPAPTPAKPAAKTPPANGTKA